jgi:alpha-L-rhamnosidase
MKRVSLILALVLILFILFGMGILTSSEENTPPGAPSGLRAEMLAQAYGLSTKNPAFSWIVNDLDANEVQTAYRIVVFDFLKQGESREYILDTHWIRSDESSYVHVSGLESKLTDNELYYWQVQTKDRNGAKSPFSRPQSFMTDIGSGWKSLSGIWKDAPSENGINTVSTGKSGDTAGFVSGNFVLFRSPRLKGAGNKAVEKAILSAAARDTESEKSQIFDLYVNGQSVGTGPARDFDNVGKYGGKSDYTQAYYNSFDVTDLWKEGSDNEISAAAYGRDRSKRGFLAQLTVFYTDGSKEVLTNSGTEDSGWKALDGTAAFGRTGRTIGTSYFQMPAEDMDIRRYPADWNTVDFDDSLWEKADRGKPVADAVRGKTGRVLTPYPSENTVRTLVNEPAKSVSENRNGILIDLGKEIIGGLKVNLNSPREQQITVRMGEQKNGDGTVRYELLAGPVYEETWTLKQGLNSFETVTMKNFRYIEIVGFEGTIEKDEIMGRAMHQPFDRDASGFQAMDGTDASDLLNRMYELSKYTMEATNQDLYTDSQARERRAYEGDVLVQSNTSYAVSDHYTLARHTNQYLLDHETWPDDYKLFAIETAWQDYLYTGNPDFLKENYDVLVKKAEIGTFQKEMGLVTGNGLIDYENSTRDGFVEGVYNTPWNAECVGIYSILSKIATVTGHETEAQKYESLSNTVRTNMIRKMYHEQEGKFHDSLNADGTPTRTDGCSVYPSIYALAYGVYDSQEMADRLAEFVAGDGEFQGSIYMSCFILRGLYSTNNGRLAMALLTNPKVGKNVRTFASVLDDLQATITPEAWGEEHKIAMTLSHPWGSSPGGAIVQGMFGIAPITPGFDRFAIRLQPGGIASAKVKTPSVKGPILVSYKQKKDGLTVKVTIPANTEAKVSLPAGDRAGSSFLVDGQAVEASRTGDYLMVSLGSGTHSLEISGGA